MQQKHRRKPTNLEKRIRNRAIWQRVVSVLTSIVVFITTYALILPALTLESGVGCGFEEHLHTQEMCYSSEDGALTCEKEEHVHIPECYTVEEADEEIGLKFNCGNGEHSHSEFCYNAESFLECSVPEHRHEAKCVLAELDPLADVETSLKWESTMAGLQLTGNWPTDMISVATSQLDYIESEKNVILEEDELKGYTRYGQWYGNPYGDWNAMFASFCLSYAGVKNFPTGDDAEGLRASVEEYKLLADPAEYAPKKGDLIFIDYSRRGGDEEIKADRVGIVAEMIPQSEAAPTQIKAIEGDADGKVAYTVYDAADAAIIGYGDLPSGELIIMEHKGEDFKVTVQMNESAGIPDSATLKVTELEKGSAEYEEHYAQSVRSLLSESSAKSEAELGISFARFFDISFIVDGVETEPVAPVDIKISYDEGIRISEDEAGVAVHFAKDGIEILDTLTKSSESKAENADSFEFTQDSFSVTGTVVSYAAKATNAYSKVDVNTLNDNGSAQYVIYTVYNGRYYAINGNGDATEIQFADDGKTITTNVVNNMLWTFTDSDGANTYVMRNAGTGRHLHSFYNNNYDNGVITTGAWASTLELSGEGADISFKVKSNGYYPYIGTINNATDFGVTTDAAAAADFYLAALPQTSYHVWFDGTNGGLMGLYGSDNTYQSVAANSTITLPSTWKSPTKYTYRLNGWYDIVSHKYYAPGSQVTIDQNTVFYADWVAGTYDVGVKNEHTVESLDTSDFVTTYVFDYNSLINAMSLSHLGTITSADHVEQWDIVANGYVPYSADGEAKKSLSFLLLDYDGAGDFSYANGRTMEMNYNRSVITPGIIEYVNSISDEDLMDILFNPEVAVMGKTYLGTGNYLFQYMDETTPNYDGHDGYYYFHSRLNAASYNQSEQRFYLYDYLERTTDSQKDRGPGEYSDFLPFNSPYANIPAGQKFQTYVSDTGLNGYMFDAKDAYTQNGTVYSATGNAGTNYWFGIRTDIEFFLPNNAGEKDKYDNYGNISTKGEHMVFEFHGDDDLWVFVDGELVLDVGGVHGVEYGQIDFSTGYVTSGEGAEEVSKTFEEVLGYNIGEGTHTLTVYYMERGSSQSNCSIYFNIAPRYSLEITKEDVFTADKLDGAEFTIYTDEACRHPAELWESEAAHREDMKDGNVDNAISTITVVNGSAKCWGISAGKTYYIKETKSPIGYPINDDMIRITLNNRGTATIETTTLNGADEEETEGFAVIKQNVNDTLKIVALTVTNQVDGDTTQLRVMKEWDESSVNIPNSIQVYLTVNGERVGRMATLTEANGWAYTWTGLPKYETDGVTEIQYTVEEVLVSGYETEHIKTENVIERIDWIRSEAMADSSTYILVNGGQALSYNGTEFSWVTPEFAKTDEGKNAQWYVTTNQYGFRLTNGSGYNLTYEPNSGIEGDYFYGTTNNDISLNQVIYFLENRLVSHDHDYYFQFNTEGDAVASDGLVFTLYRKDVLTGTLVNIKNTPIEEDKQTHLEVNKLWDDLLDHSADEVTIHLYADGKDTGRTLVLSQANGWKGSFEGLPYYGADGVTPVVYSVVEADFDGYDPIYSAPTEVAGRTLTCWINSDSLINGSIYRFTSGAYALAVDLSGNLISKVNDPTDTTQQWQVEVYGTSYVLKNVGYGYYPDADNNNLFTAGNANSASAIVLSNGILKIGSRYLQITPNAISSSWYENNGTSLNVIRQATVSAMPGTSVTVTNIEEAYVLPNTGGEGNISSLYSLGGALTAAAASMYICEFGRKRRKKGGI